MLFHDQNEFDVSPSRMCSVDQTDRTISLLPQLTSLSWSASLLVFCAKTTISGGFFLIFLLEQQYGELAEEEIID